jgi:hypothetical protein
VLLKFDADQKYEATWFFGDVSFDLDHDVTGCVSSIINAVEEEKYYVLDND